MEQDNIYRVLLELKETTGRIEAKVETIKEATEEQSNKHDKLREDHNELKSSHDSYKGRVLLVSGGVGSIFGALVAYVKLKWIEWFS